MFSSLLSSKEYTHEFLLIGPPTEDDHLRTVLAYHKPYEHFVELTTTLHLEVSSTLLGEMKLHNHPSSSHFCGTDDLANSIATEVPEAKTSPRRLFAEMQQRNEQFEGGDVVLVPIYLATVTTDKDRLMYKPLEPTSFAPPKGYIL